MKTLLSFALYEDFEEHSVIGIVKDKRRITTLIKNHFKEALNQVARDDNYIFKGVQYKTKIGISFDKEKDIYHAWGVITDIEMKKEFHKLPKRLKNDLSRSLFAYEYEFEGFYRLDEAEEI